MDKINEKKDSYIGYILIAVVLAFVGYFFLNFLFKALVVVLSVAFKYWWGVLIIVIILLLLRRMGGKKQ